MGDKSHSFDSDEKFLTIYYLKYISFSICVAQLCAGAGFLGAGVWIYHAENIWMKSLDRAYVYHGAILIITGSVVLVVGSFLGALASVKRIQWLLCIFIFFQFCVFSIMLSAGIVGVVAKGYYPEELRGFMKSSLQYNYGVNLQDPYNRRITSAWDRLQTEEECCSVEDKSWGLYRSSEWYAVQPGVVPDGGTQSGDGGTNLRPYVPNTCCVVDFGTNSYDDLVKCQTSLRGPPKVVSGQRNSALHEKGCYEIVLELHRDKSQNIIGIGFTVSLLTLPGSTVAFILYILLWRHS